MLPLVLAGVIEVHNHGLATSRTANLGLGSHFTFEGNHSNLPRHIEAGSEVESPDCPACLHSLSARGLQVSLAPALGVEVSSERLALAPDCAPSDPCALWVGGRSPPLA
ncbi:MAG TPA: hypothetical protein VF173_07990 [Thermoanaerobaculia bacterium]|nr:hypothetical protein [Thermoanaerobaculia bacterium]